MQNIIENPRSKHETLKKIKLVEAVDKYRKNSKNILQVLHFIQLLLDNRFNEKAGELCEKLKQMVEDPSNELDLGRSGDECCKKITELIKKFPSEHVDGACALFRCQYCLIKRLFEGTDLLKKLRSLGALMNIIAQQLDKRRDKNRFKQILCFMDDVERDMERVYPTDIDGLKTKCFELCCFLCSYAYCCHRLSKHAKAKQLYLKTTNFSLFFRFVTPLTILSATIITCMDFAIIIVGSLTSFSNAGLNLND